MAVIFRIAVLFLAGFEIFGFSPSADKYGPYDLSSSLPHTTDGAKVNWQYLPAPPGHTPPCARPGATYCDQVDQYPTYVVWKLIERWAFDHNTLFRNEAFGQYKDGDLPTLGVQQFDSDNTSRHRGDKFSNGYADRRYFLNVEQIGFTYGSSVIPAAPSSNHFVNPLSWWRAYRRRRRQASSRINVDLCPTEARYIAPRAALSQQGSWMYIVNLPETDNKYTQLVLAKPCTNPKQGCNAICGLPEGYSSQCVQEFVQKRLVALEGTGHRLYTDVFWFPHGCSCQVPASI